MTNKEIDTVCEKMGVQIHHNKFWYDGLIIGIITPDDFGNCKVSVITSSTVWSALTVIVKFLLCTKKKLTMLN